MRLNENLSWPIFLIHCQGPFSAFSKIAFSATEVWQFMFGRVGKDGPDYIHNRTREAIPKRLEQDMFHAAWNRAYAGEVVYNWLLQYKKAMGVSARNHLTLTPG